MASLTFLVHAQHEAGISMLLLVMQHRCIDATLFVLAAAVLLSPFGDARGIALSLLSMLPGLQLLVHAEGDSPFRVPAEGRRPGSA